MTLEHCFTLLGMYAGAKRHILYSVPGRAKYTTLPQGCELVSRDWYTHALLEEAVNKQEK